MIRDLRPEPEEKTNLAPSTIKKTTLPKAKASKQASKWDTKKLGKANEFEKGEEVVIVGIKDKHLNGKECKIVEYEPNLDRWEVELGEDDDASTMFLSSDHLQAKYKKQSDDGPGFKS